MRIGEEGCGSVPDGLCAEFDGAEHAAFDVEMAVDESRSDVFPRDVDHFFCFLAGQAPNPGDNSVLDKDIPFENPAGTDIDDLAFG